MIVGIDPGATGGVAAIDKSGRFVGGIRMPVVKVTPKRKVVRTAAFAAMIATARHHRQDEIIDLIVIEQVNSMPGQGVASSFTFGQMAGAVEAWAVGTGRPVEWVTPAVWKKAMNLGKSKQESLDKARVSFGDDPLWGVKANDGIAEAALIALYWQRQRS